MGWAVSYTTRAPPSRRAGLDICEERLFRPREDDGATGVNHLGDPPAFGV